MVLSVGLPHRSTTPRFANWDQLQCDHINITACFLYCTCTCSDIIITAILVPLLSLLLSFLSSSHLLSPIPTIHVPAGFVTLSFLNDEESGFGRNIWIKWPWHHSVIFWLVVFPIIIMQQPSHAATFRTSRDDFYAGEQKPLGGHFVFRPGPGQTLFIAANGTSSPCILVNAKHCGVSLSIDIRISMAWGSAIWF